MTSQEIMMKSIVQRSQSHLDNNEGVRITHETHFFRMRLCYAFFLDNIPFTCLQNQNPNGLAGLLRNLGTYKRYDSISS